MQGKHIVIVGGSAGIGLALAARLVSMGAQVTITGRNPERLAEARAALGGAVDTATFDVADEAAVAAFFTGVRPIDHLAILAGDLIGGRVTDTRADLVRAAMDVRFWGSYHAAHHGAPHMNAGGSITLTAGAAAWRPIIGEAVAGASCGAVESFGRSLAVELAPLRVNTVTPGYVATDLLRYVIGDSYDEVIADFGPRLPVGRIGRPEEVADAFVFLMGNGYMTGATLNVDGGHHLI
jgi:NAD(P)-dependent dehydrogenase (short-subunit alcohol dehydrogenase family)